MKNLKRSVSGWRIVCIVVGLVFGGVGLERGALAGTQVVAWGDNTYGQTNVPAGLTNIIAIAGGSYHSLALRSDGTVVAWGYNYFGQTNVPTGLTNVINIAAGDYHSLALKSDGTAMAWGNNTEFQGIVPSWITDVVAIAAGANHNIFLRRDGTVLGYGANDYGQASPPTGLSNVVAITAAGQFSLALKSNGTVVAWGDYRTGITNIPLGLTNVVAIAAGAGQAFALHPDGTIDVWGSNYGAGTNLPPNLTNVVSLECGSHVLAQQTDGTVFAWGDNSFGKATVPIGLTNVAAVAVGGDFSLALTFDKVPLILVQPANMVTFSGAQVALSTKVLSAPPVSYQWQLNGNDIGGATSSTLVFPKIQAADSGNFRVVVSNSFGTTISSIANISVSDSAPVISVSPLIQAVVLGTGAKFTNSTIGSLPLSYQWRFNGRDIAGATATALTLNNVLLTDEGNYSVVVSNVFGVSFSSNAFLNVVDLSESLDATNLTWNPQTNSPWVAETAFTKDGVAAARSGTIGNNGKSTIQTSTVGPGTLSFWWKVSSQTNSDFLRFFVDGNQQASISGEAGWQRVIYYLGVGTNTVSWSYSKDVAGYVGQDAGWLDQVNFSPGGTLPNLSISPVSQSVSAGVNATFNCAAVGTPPLSYQWQFNGGIIENGTSATFVLTNAQAGNVGDYSVVVSNAYGNIISSNAVLSVNAAAPFILQQPANDSVLFGTDASFTVSLRGSEPMFFQWQVNGTNLPGAMNAILSIKDADQIDGGKYRLTVTNALGRVTSSDAYLIKTFPYSITTIAGSTGSHGTSDGTNTSAQFWMPWDITRDKTGNLYVADRYNNTIRKIDTNGVAITLAGRPGLTGTNDGVGSAARFYQPSGVAVDNGGTVYVADTFNSTIRKITPDGAVSTFAGTGGTAGTGNGVGSAARFNGPTGVALDSKTNLYVVEFYNHCIRKITPDGTVTTFAGLPGTYGYPGNGSGSVARFYYPEHLAIDKDDNIYVTDGLNFQIRKVTPAGVVSTWVGAPSPGTTDGVGSNARFGLAKGVAVDGLGNVYVADTTNHTIRKITSAGVVSTICGMSSVKGGADGVWTNVRFNEPTGITVDDAGNLYIVDSVNNTIRKGVPVSAASIVMQPVDQTVSVGGNATFSVIAAGTGAVSYQWRMNGVNLAAGTNASLSLTNVQLADAGAYSMVVSNQFGMQTSSNAVLTVLRVAPQFRVSGANTGWSSNGFGMQLNALSGHGAVVIYGSTNLSDWVPLLTNPPVIGTLPFLDSTATNLPSRFYKAEEQ